MIIFVKFGIILQMYMRHRIYYKHHLWHEVIGTYHGVFLNMQLVPEIELLNFVASNTLMISVKCIFTINILQLPCAFSVLY